MQNMNNIFFINGPAGKLECLYLAGHSPQQKITAVICHPHPLYQGTMYNKVVTTLAQTFRDLGIDSIRFNFRGVGQSEGSYDEGIGELQDCLTIIDFIKQKNPDHAILLAGFSFGGAIAMRAATTISPIALVTVAPAVHGLRDPLTAITCPWIIVQADDDDITLPDTLNDFIKTRHENPHLIRFPEAGHFFHGQLTVLKQQLTDALKSYDIISA